MKIYCVIDTTDCGYEIFNSVTCFKDKQEALDYLKELYDEYYIYCKDNQYTDIDEYDPEATCYNLVSEEDDTLYMIELHECEIE